MAKQIRSWDDYFIPGTSVLRNKFNESDPDRLQLKEQQASRLRLAELAAHPIEPADGRFDYDHMKAIHRHLFQDVYEWAGQERVGPPLGQFMTKAGPDVVNFAPGDPNARQVGYAYYPGDAIADDAERRYRMLERENYLTGLAQPEFVDRLAEHWGELNTIHSFREGNTRVQFVFFAQLADHAGYQLDTEAFAAGHALRDEFVWARFYHQATTSHDRLATVLAKAITPTPPSTAADGDLTAEELAEAATAERLAQFTRPAPTATTAPSRRPTSANAPTRTERLTQEPQNPKRRE